MQINRSPLPQAFGPPPIFRRCAYQLSALAIAVLAACAAPVASVQLPNSGVGSEDQPLDSQQAIVNGQSTQGYPAVGLMTTFPHQRQGTKRDECAGSLIGSRLVLTAAHCVLAYEPGQPKTAELAQPQDISFHLGSYLPDGSASQGQGEDFAVTRISLPGGDAFDVDAFAQNVNNGKLNNNDLALVELDHDSTVTPLRVLSVALQPKSINAALTVVGYGSTGRAGISGDGQKRMTTLQVKSYDDHLFTAGATNTSTCSGDSGGPALWGNAIVGLTQAGTPINGYCAGAPYFTRVDPWAGFLLGSH